MTLAALYLDYPFWLEMLDGYREGWVPRNLIVTFLVLVVGLIVFLAALVFVVWKSQTPNDR